MNPLKLMPIGLLLVLAAIYFPANAQDNKTDGALVFQLNQLTAQQPDTKHDQKTLSLKCEGGNYVECYNLAVGLESGEYGTVNAQEAIRLYQLACDKSVGVSCSNLGIIYEDGKIIPRDFDRALGLYAKSCDLKFGKACNNAGYFYLNGVALRRDLGKAARYFGRGCELDDEMSCSNLADRYIDGLGVHADFAHGMRLRIRACRGLFGPACDRLESDLVNLARHGQSLPPIRGRPGKSDRLDQVELEARWASVSGRPDEAQRLIASGIKSLPDANEPDASGVLHFVMLSASFYEQHGAYRFARETLEDQLNKIDRLTTARSSLYLALMLSRLSELDRRAGDAHSAHDHLARALAMERSLGREEVPDLAAGYNTLGLLSQELGDNAGALNAFTTSWKILEGLGQIQPAATALNNMSVELMHSGQYQEALDNFLRALNVRKTLLPADDPVIAQNLGNISTAFAALGNEKRAINYGGEELDAFASRIGQRSVRGDSIVADNFDHELGEEWLGVLSWLVSLDFLYEGQEGSRDLAASAVATLHGYETETLTTLVKSLRTENSAEAKTLLASFQAALGRFSEKYYEAPHDFDTWPAVLSGARAELGAAAARLVKENSKASMWTTFSNDAVRALVPKRTALVVYTLYGRADPQAKSERARYSEPRLAAYIFEADKPTTAVDFGPVDQILALKSSALGKLASHSVGKLSVLRQLYAALIEPLEKNISDADDLLVVPGEALADIPFEALINKDNKYLIEEKNVRYLSSPTELRTINLNKKNAVDLGRSVVIAGLNYGDGEGLRLGMSMHPDQTSPILRFTPLSGSADEGAAVAGQLRGGPVFAGDKVTKEFLKTIHGPPVVHISSHGFYLGPGVTPAWAAELVRRASESLTTDSEIHELPSEEPALVRSGIAISGANGEMTGGVERNPFQGLLTAAEVEGLDLNGTELVALSACESGVGEPTPGEGVQGMRTALRIAGAQTRVLSLWPVSDCATTAFMTKWYRRLARGDDRVSALRDVKISMIKRQLVPTTARCRQLADNWADPYFWASFVAEGAAGPLVYQ